VFLQQTDCKSFSPRRRFSFIWREIETSSESADIGEMLLQPALGCTFHFQFSLNCAANLRKDVVCVRANQVDCAHQNDEDYGEHDRVFRNSLALFRSQFVQVETPKLLASRNIWVQCLHFLYIARNGPIVGTRRSHHRVLLPNSPRTKRDALFSLASGIHCCPRNEKWHPKSVTLVKIRDALARTYEDVDRNHTLQMAAALSYYFVLSVFPALILLSAVVAYLPVPDLFDQALNLIARFLPPDSMGLIRKVLSDVITPNKGTFLSFGILGTLWAASGGFAAAIEALNIAYDVKDDRPFWKTRPLAVALAFMTGILVLIALLVMIVGPEFGGWLAGQVHLTKVFVLLWPYIHWSIAIGFTVLAVEALYFMAPNVQQRFLPTLPGAILAVGSWIALSYLLGLYFRHFANFNKTYGTLGAAVALMVWLYWTAFAMLVGAELNAELAKESSGGRIESKHEPPAITQIDLAA
jgi:membrane protein